MRSNRWADEKENQINVDRWKITHFDSSYKNQMSKSKSKD